MYQQDIFEEATVSRKPSGLMKALYVASIVIAVISFLLMLMVGVFGLLMTVIFGILAWWLKQNIQIDFDYSITNGEIDIARIRGSEKRKLVFAGLVDDIKVMAPAHTQPVIQYEQGNMKTLDATSKNPEATVYTLIIKNQKTNEDTKIYWEPSEEMVEVLHRQNPYQIRTAKEFQ